MKYQQISITSDDVISLAFQSKGKELIITRITTDTNRQIHRNHFHPCQDSGEINCAITMRNIAFELWTKENFRQFGLCPRNTELSLDEKHEQQPLKELN